MMTLQKFDASPFLDAAAVEAWDTWFRLREHGRLRDISVEATWERVARALAASSQPVRWVSRVIDAQARWNLVLDARIVAGAGTATFVWPDDPVAVVNAATFVSSPFSRSAQFDFCAFRATADLAVECLDNALQLNARAGADHSDLQVGLIGVADTLAMLNKRYDSASGRVLASRMAQALAEACLGADVRLARTRGAMSSERTDAAIMRARKRGMPRELIEAAECTGLRHSLLTAIHSQRRLAEFANHATDAIDPLPGGNPPARTYAAIIAGRTAVAAGPCADMLPLARRQSISAQLALRGAMQPWIDAPINYALKVDELPDSRAAAHWRQLAAAHHLGDLTLHRHA